MLKDMGNEFNKSRTSPSSLIFTIIFSISSKILWKLFNCSIMDLFSTLLNEYNCCFIHNLWSKDFVILNDSIFVHIKSKFFSNTTFHRNLSSRHKIMTHYALFTISAFFAYAGHACINASPVNAQHTSIACIFTFQNPNRCLWNIYRCPI